MNLFKRSNLYYWVGIFSKRQTDNIFLKSKKLEFDISCKLSHWIQFARNVKVYFLGTIRKMFETVVC